MGKRLTVAMREISSLKSEKTIVLALLIQLFIAAFSSFLVVGLVSLYDPGSVSNDVQLEFGVSGDASEGLAEIVERQDGMEANVYPNYSTAVSEFRDGNIDGVFDAQRLESGRVSVQAIAPQSSIRTTLIVVRIKSVLEDFERAERKRLSSSLENDIIRLPSEGKSESSPYFSFTYTVLIPLLMFLPVFISGSIASDSITEEFERGTIELLRVAPLSEMDIIDGKMLAMASIAPIQSAVWLGLLSFNGTRIANPLEILGIVTAFSLVVVVIGSVVAMRFRDRRQAQFIYSIGILGVFGGTQLLQEPPANTIAKLAIGSPTQLSYISIGIYVVGGALIYLAGRKYMEYVGLET